MDESLDSFVDLGCLEEDVGAVDVALGEVERVTEGVIHVSLGGKVHDGINVLFCHHIRYKVRTADISLDEFEVLETRHFLEVGETGAIVQLVVDNNVVCRVLRSEEDSHMRGNETSTTGEEDVPGNVVCFFVGYKG